MEEKTENKNNHATFEDLWSSVLDDSPPSSQVSSPVHNQQFHAHNQNHQRRKKRFKIRSVSGHPSSPKLNEVEQAFVNQAIKDSLSNFKRGRGSRVHQTNLNNTQNNAYSLSRLSGGKSTPSTAGVNLISKSNHSKTRPVCTQSRPETVSPSQQTLSTPKQTNSPAISMQTPPESPPDPSPTVTMTATSIQTPPKGDQLPTVNTASQQRSPPKSQSTSNHDIPQMPRQVPTTCRPQKAPSVTPSVSSVTPSLESATQCAPSAIPVQSATQCEPSSVSSESLPPGFNYMSVSQKQLFLEFQQQQQQKRTKQQVFPSVSQQHQQQHKVQQAPPVQGTLTHQQPIQGQGIPPPSRNYQQNLENLHRGQGVSPESSNQQLHQLPSSSQHLQQHQLQEASYQQQHQLEQCSPSKHGVSPQNVQTPNFQSGSPSNNQQMPVPYYPVQQQQQLQQNQQLQQQRQQHQQLQQSGQQSLQNPREQVLQPQLSQPQSPNSVSNSAVEKRKPEHQRDDDVQPKKPRNEDVQPQDEPATEPESASGPTNYQVGGENNMVVHAPKGCTFNIYQNRSQQSGLNGDANGGRRCDTNGARGDCNGNCGANGGNARMNQKQHAIEWAGATTETDSGIGTEATGVSVPIAMFRDMSKSIGRKWKFLARQLPMVEYGLLESELKNLDECSGTEMDKSLAVLTKWWKENPDSWDAQKMKRQLEDALRECQLVRLARNIDETFRALSV